MDKEEINFEPTVLIEPKVGLKYQLSKLLIATAAGFIASRMAEMTYDAILEKRRQNAGPAINL